MAELQSNFLEVKKRERERIQVRHEVENFRFNS